jgi:hypothetical protein
MSHTTRSAPREMTEAEAERAAAAIGLRIAAEAVLEAFAPDPADAVQIHALDWLRRSVADFKAATAAYIAERDAS